MSTSSIPAMAMFSSLDKFWMLSELKLLGASQHPDEGVCQFSLLILAISQSSDALLDHITDYLRFMSNINLSGSPVDSVWTRKTTRLCRHLVVPAGCHIAYCRPLIALPSRAQPLDTPPSHRLIILLCCLSLSCCASWLWHHHLSSSSCCTALSSSHRAGRLLCCLSLRSSSCRLVTPAGCHIAYSCPLFAPPSRQLVAPACCCIASPLPLDAPHAALSSSCCTGWLLRRLMTCHSLVISSSCCATSHFPVAPAGCCNIISCHPLVAPLSCPLIVPLPTSNADARRRHPPLLMSISIVVSSWHVCSPYRHRCCRH